MASLARTFHKLSARRQRKFFSITVTRRLKDFCIVFPDGTILWEWHFVDMSMWFERGYLGMKVNTIALWGLLVWCQDWIYRM